jgi:hypothetical protein
MGGGGGQIRSRCAAKARSFDKEVCGERHDLWFGIAGGRPRYVRLDKGKTRAFVALQVVVRALAKQAAETKMGWLSVDKLIEKRDTVSFGNLGDWGVYTEQNERIQELKKERTKGNPRTPQ